MALPAPGRRFRADRGDARERLDRVLVRHLADLPDLSRSRVHAWIDDGRVRVNGQPARRPAARLATGDEVEVDLPPPPPAREPPAAQEIPLVALYEDDYLLALDKPPGMVAHPAHGNRDGTLVNALLWRARSWPPGTAPRLVHRLDRGTSGVLLVAKSRAAHAAVARQMAGGRVEKEYLAIVYGRSPAAKGRIAARIFTDPADRRRQVVPQGEASEGRDALTFYERLGEWPAPGETGVALTLLRCTLGTGRTHQIRVHLSAHGLPIVGDPLYGEPRWKGILDLDLAALCRDLPRQALHAYRLALLHPVTRERLEIEAPVPPDLRTILDRAGLKRA